MLGAQVDSERGEGVLTVRDWPEVGVELKEAVATVQWSRTARANAFSEGLVEQVLDAVHHAAVMQPRVLVLLGEGPRFSGGFDLAGDNEDDHLAWRFARSELLLQAVREFPAVTVACVVGPAFGLGADLVCSCDYRIGDESSRFRFPGPRFGVVLGTHQLRSRVGAARATDILLRNELVSAATALADGLLTGIFPAEQHRGYVEELSAACADLDNTTVNSLLRALRPAIADPAMAALSRSTHAPGLADRIDRYRSAVLSNR